MTMKILLKKVNKKKKIKKSRFTGPVSITVGGFRNLGAELLKGGVYLNITRSPGSPTLTGELTGSAGSPGIYIRLEDSDEDAV